MNDQTITALDKLASQLGTTSEYLWGILLRQAPFSATVLLVQIILIFIAVYALYRLHVYFSTEDEDGRSLYYEKQEVLQFPMFICACILGIFIIAAFLLFENILWGFFNPEYWALTEVVSALKAQ